MKKPSGTSSKLPIRTKTIIPMMLGCIMLSACGNAKTKANDGSTAKDATATSVKKLDSKAEADLKAKLKANLKASGFDTEINSITSTKMPGMYWISAKGLPAFFTDSSGKYIVQGQIVEIGGNTPVDITANLQKASAKALLAKVDKKDMISYKPKGEVKAVVYAFTDVDCGYCRKLHSEMKDINDAGIEVRYLAWPRSPQSVPGMVSIWCAKDRNAAMTTGKSGGKVASATCDNPVEAQMELGHQLGVRGTPAIFTESGAQIGGYLPAADLAKAAIANK